MVFKQHTLEYSPKLIKRKNEIEVLLVARPAVYGVGGFEFHGFGLGW